jgi:hypothetical protein
MQMGAYMYNRDYQALPVHELKLAAYTIVTNGGSPVYITNTFPDGSVDQVLSERMAAVFREIETKRQYLEDTGELDFAALYFSRESQIFTDSANPEERRYLTSFEGAYKALTEEHVPFRILGRAALRGGGAGRRAGRGRHVVRRERRRADRDGPHFPD